MNNNTNPLLNQHRTIPPLDEIHHHHGHIFPSSQLDPHDDFLDQMLSSVPSSFPWSDDHAPPHLDDHSAAALASKMRHHQISNGAAAKAAFMLQQQLFLNNAANGLRSPTGSDGGDGHSFKSVHPANDASVEALLNGLTGSLGQTSNQPHHFHHPQAQNFGSAGAAAAPAMSQPAASGSSGGAAAPRQRVRARRGQATDPHSIAERLRRERIAERMKALQELVPNANKTDKASMLDEIIDYVKFLQLQVKVLSMSRLGGAGAVKPPVADMSPEGKSGNGTQTASSPNNNDGMTVTENQVAKLMEEDMGSAMQYLQGTGLCLMPISLATAISTATSHSRNPLLNGGSPTSPNISALTIQSAIMGGKGGGESVSKN